MKIVSIYIDKEGVIFGSDERVPKSRNIMDYVPEDQPMIRWEDEKALTLWKQSLVRFENQTKSKFKVVLSDGSVGNLLFAFVDNQASCFNIPRPIECEVIMSDDMGLPNTNQRLLAIKESPVKEESQEELWRKVIEICDDGITDENWTLNELQKHFTITRK